jgi:hypothetical protein
MLLPDAAVAACCSLHRSLYPSLNGLLTERDFFLSYTNITLPVKQSSNPVLQPLQERRPGPLNLLQSRAV